MRLSCAKSSLFRCFIILILFSTCLLVFLTMRYVEFFFKDDLNIYNDFSQGIIIESRAPYRFAVISTSLASESKFYYMLYIPICAIAWRRIGYEPLVLMVRNRNSTLNGVSYKTIQYLKKFRIRVLNIEAPLENANQLGMIARLFLGGLPDDIVHDDDFLLTTDSDLLPIKKNYFNFYNTKAISILNAFNIGKVMYRNKEVDMYPMAYVGMRKWQWRGVMNLSRNFKLNGEMIMSHMREIHGVTQFRKNTDIVRGDNVWYLDQKTLTTAINNYVDRDPANRKLNKYKFSGDRLDRSDSNYEWYRKLKNLDNVIDSHMFHDDVRLKINLIMDLLQMMFSKKICDKIIVYFSEFFSLIV
jgi:hypothetical protein